MLLKLLHYIELKTLRSEDVNESNTSRLMTKPTKWHVRAAKTSAQSDQGLRCPHEQSLAP